MTMMLDVFALPRGARSRTRRLREAFLRGYLSAHPGTGHVQLDLARDHASLPSLDEWDIEAKFEMMYGEGKLDNEQAQHWNALTKLTDQLHAADLIVLSCPMWNFSIPWMLKRWIDCVVQAKLTWELRAGEYHGLLGGRTGVILVTRDGDYPEGTPKAALDHQVPYLKQMLAFVGIAPVHVVIAEPLSVADRAKSAGALELAMVEAEKLGRSLP
jgi:FMN-dependent NADH-azoreductase